MNRVVCAVNESLYYQMLCKGLLQSLLKHRSIPYKITVLLDGENFQPFDDLHEQIEIIPVKPLDIICGCISSRTTYARLEIPYIFPYEKRILYLDVDTYIINDIQELFITSFQTIAAVIPGKDLMIKELLKREFKSDLKKMNYELDSMNYSVGTDDHKYFNAGVMLIDPYQWRKLRIKQHVEALTRTHASAMYTSDEMALNLIFHGHFTELRSCYNIFNFTAKYLTEIPRIWHFNTYKPIIHAPLNQFHTWLTFFKTDDQILLKKLENISHKFGNVALLAIKSQIDTQRIQGAVLIGSFGRGQGSSVSDIDIELLMVDDKTNINDFINDIIQLFSQTEESLFVKHTIWLRDQRKLALYHGPQKYFLVDREDRIHQYLQYILTLPYDNRQGLIHTLISSIQFHLESTSSARQRSNAYKFYFLSNITLHELVRLTYILNSKIEYNYNPPQSIVNSNLSSTMDLKKSGIHLINLRNFFLEQLNRIEDNQAIIVKKARDFCQNLLKRDSL